MASSISAENFTFASLQERLNIFLKGWVRDSPSQRNCAELSAQSDVAYSTVKALQLHILNKTNGLTLIYYLQFIHSHMGREETRIWQEGCLKLIQFLRPSFKKRNKDTQLWYLYIPKGEYLLG